MNAAQQKDVSELVDYDALNERLRAYLEKKANACRVYFKRFAEYVEKKVDLDQLLGAKGLGVLPLFPIFRHFFNFHKNLSSSVISGTFSRENRFPPKPKKRPKIAKHTKHEPLPKRDAISLKFP